MISAGVYATVTDTVRVAAALLASKIYGRLASPLTAREVYLVVGILRQAGPFVAVAATAVSK